MRPFNFSNGKVVYSSDVLRFVESIHDLATKSGKDPDCIFEEFTTDLIREGEIAAAAVLNGAWDQKYRDQEHP